ncbi:hypothetical protein BGZ63DRAFT_414342 [Mariannaea sp. PMI_226]|nr:hypothetical protein BGZ63DRAFT_414342 [Mariannaea sp. PMI_226]
MSAGTDGTPSSIPSPQSVGSSGAMLSGARPISAAPSPSASATPGAPHRAPLSIKPSAKPPPPVQPQSRTALPSANKMAMSSVISPNLALSEAPKVSMTSKEWVIPPRPKPGRKPATDTPPTKRKAQNRAAQRAFRERRAARVGELEEQLDQQREIYEKQEAELKDKIHELELDVQSFRSRCMLLENMLDRERQERILVETKAETLKRRLDEREFQSGYQSRNMSHSQPTFESLHSPSSQAMRHSLSDNRPVERERQVTQTSFSISQIISAPETHALGSSNDSSESALTCGNCSPNGRCACAEEVMAAAAGCGKCSPGSTCHCLDAVTEVFNPPQELKRPASPSAVRSSEKRYRPSTEQNEVETDFTAMFSRKPPAAVPPESHYSTPSSADQVPSLDPMAFKDGCGFCKDGTYCVCADTSLATPAMTPSDTLPPISQQVQTPPPSETDAIPPMMAMEMTADGAVKLPRRQPNTQASQSRGCGSSGPGTCAQCQSDPKSGLFCRLMAANFDRSGGKAGGCCGGKGADGGCCKGPKKEKITLPSLPSLGLSCAEAYQTLSSHRNFSKAADDIGSWLPKLRATPKAGAQPQQSGSMMPIEVEAASIMSVLRDFDIRFGRGF